MWVLLFWRECARSRPRTCLFAVKGIAFITMTLIWTEQISANVESVPSITSSWEDVVSKAVTVQCNTANYSVVCETRPQLTRSIVYGNSRLEVIIRFSQFQCAVVVNCARFMFAYSFSLPRSYRLTFTWRGCCGLCLWHKPTELAHSFLFCSSVCFCL